jgi:hypothetical protein
MRPLNTTSTFFMVTMLIITTSEFAQGQSLEKPRYRTYDGLKNGHHSYSDDSYEFPNAGVADDFGPRELPSGYDFHSGIDNNGDVLMADGTMDKDVDDLISFKKVTYVMFCDLEICSIFTA